MGGWSAGGDRRGWDTCELHHPGYTVLDGRACHDGHLQPVRGGTVFNAATMGWGRGLWPEDNPNDYQIVRQITRNILDRLSSGGSVPPLVFSIQADRDPSQAGSQLGYTIRVTNTADVDLFVTITDTLPAHTIPGGTLAWNPSIPAGGVWTEMVDVSVESDYAGPLTSAVQVSAAGGATRAYTHTVNAEVPISGLAASTDSPPSLGQDVALTATTLSGSNISRIWNFGDGSVPLTSGETSVLHTYRDAGVYMAVVTATNGVSLATAATTVTVTHSTHDIAVRVIDGLDDAEEMPGGSMSLSSSDLELVFDYGDQIVALRFNNIDIPQAASILSATVQFQVDEVSSAPTSLSIKGQADDNALAFSSSNASVSSRPTSGASISWNPPPWTAIGQAGPDQRRPDIAPVIQEIVNRSGWSPGNSLVIVLSGTGERVAESYNGSPDGAPLLRVEYSTAPPVNQPPTVDAGPDQSITLPHGAQLYGTVSDDGLPGPTPSLTTVWTQLSGPAAADFADQQAIDTLSHSPRSATTSSS